jgi:hypothetical protein
MAEKGGDAEPTQDYKKRKKGSVGTSGMLYRSRAYYKEKGGTRCVENKDGLVV